MLNPNLNQFKTVAIFGARETGIKAMAYLRKTGYMVEGIFDNDSSLWGTRIDGLKVSPPTELYSNPINYDRIVIASSAADEISRELQANGLHKLLRFTQASLSLMPAEIPSILVITMPKSGTMNILHTLLETFQEIGVASTDVQGGRFPFNGVNRLNAHRLALGGMVGTCHLFPTEINLHDLITCGVTRIVVHVRDPRDALLSWLRWIDNKNRDGTIAPHEKPMHPDFFSLEKQRKIDILLETYFTHLIRFLKGWMSIPDLFPELSVKISTFEEMKSDPDSFFKSILAFNHIDTDIFPPTVNMPKEWSPEDIKKRHFAKGLSREWENVYTNEQKMKAEEKIPIGLLDYFRL